MMAGVAQAETEPQEGISTSPNTLRPTWVLCTHQQHMADYVHLMVKAGMSLHMEDYQSVPLVTEVFFFFLFLTSHTRFLFLSHFWSFSFIHSSMFPLFLQTLQKIHLADHIHSLAELLHTDALHQLEVALLGSPAANLIDVLSVSLQSMSSMQHQAVPLQPSVTTSMSPSPPPSLLWVLPIQKSQMKLQPLQVGVWQPHLSQRRSQHHPSASIYFPMPIPATTQRSCSPSGTLSSGAPFSLLLIVVPELAIPPYAHPEQINHPGGHKDYKCQGCSFQHTNRDCMLMHICQHLEISISCSMCGKGFQNMASLLKHGNKVHAIQIVEAEDE